MIRDLRRELVRIAEQLTARSVAIDQNFKTRGARAGRDWARERR